DTRGGPGRCSSTMASGRSSTSSSPNVAARVRDRIERGGERVWRFEDFSDLPPQAVAQALSRLARSRSVERLAKGTYYRSRATPFGRSRPDRADLQRIAARRKPIFPS